MIGRSPEFANRRLRTVLLLALCTALALLLLSCGTDGFGYEEDRKAPAMFIGLHGDLYTVTCTKGEDGSGTYSVYNSSTGMLITSGMFDPKKEACYDVQDDIISGPLAYRPPGADFAKASAATAPPLQYILDVSNYYCIQIVNSATATSTEVDLPGGGDAPYPVSAAMTPDGKSIWVLQYGIPPNNQGLAPQPPLITIMDTTAQAFTGSFNLPSGISADTIRFSPDGTTAYVSNNGAPFLNNTGVPANSSVLVVDVATQTLRQTIATPKGAGFEAMSPDGLLLYTISNNLGGGANTLTAIDTTTETVAAYASLPNGAIKMFINPTGTRLYLFWYQGIVVFDTATLQQVAAIPTVGFSLRNNFANFSPDGRTAWFCNCGYGIYYQVDMRTNQIVNTVQGQNLSHGFMFMAPN